MKTFLATYKSRGNLEQGSVCVRAESITDAQDKFFIWIKTNCLYQHMWHLNVEFQEIEDFIE